MSPSNIKKLKRVCPICFCDKAESLYEIKFAKDKNEKIPDSYDIVACNKCGFVFSDTSWNQKDYDNYYERAIRFIKGAAGGGDIALHDMKRYEKQVNQISNFISKNSLIADIGCAKGGLLRTLKGKGYNKLFAIDPLNACVDFVKNTGIKGCTGNALYLDKLNEKYDVIIMSHVIEHIYDLNKLLLSINNALNDGGILYVEVPNAEKYENKFFKPYFYFDIDHINHFSKISLTNCFSKFETLVIDEGYMNMPNDIPYPIIYGVFRKSKRNNLSFNKNNKYEQDIYTVNVVKEYIKESKKIDMFNGELKNIDRTKPCFLWGLGTYLRRLLLNKNYFNDLEILAILDRDESFEGNTITTYDGRQIPVLNSKYFPNSFKKYNGGNVNVIITAVLWGFDIRDKLLKDNDFKGDVFIL